MQENTKTVKIYFESGLDVSGLSILKKGLFS